MVNRGIQLSLATTFVATAVVKLATTVLNVTGPKHACIVAVQPIPAMFVLRLSRALAIRLHSQVQGSPTPTPYAHTSPECCSQTPISLSFSTYTPIHPRTTTHGETSQPPTTPAEASGTQGRPLLQELMKGKFGTPIREQRHSPGELKLTTPLQEQVLTTQKTLLNPQEVWGAEGATSQESSEYVMDKLPHSSCPDE